MISARDCPHPVEAGTINMMRILILLLATAAMDTWCHSKLAVRQTSYEHRYVSRRAAFVS